MLSSQAQTREISEDTEEEKFFQRHDRYQRPI